MDLGLSTAADESANDSPMKLKLQPPLEQEHGHGHEHEHKNGSNGNTATGDNGQADTASASTPDAGDAELQRRKAALLQQVLISISTLPQLQALVMGRKVSDWRLCSYSCTLQMRRACSHFVCKGL